MSEEYGNDYVTLTDENGNELELEHLDTLEYNGNTYMAVIPADDGSDSLDLEVSISNPLRKTESRSSAPSRTRRNCRPCTT